MLYDVVIVGAGPAALFTAANLNQNLNVILLEKMERPAKKLLVSGSGRCNYTHAGDLEHFLKKYGNAGNFLKHALYGFTNLDSLNYFRSKGMKSVTEESGKIFPQGDAGTILGILENEIEKKGFEIVCSTKVINIFKNDVFEILTNRGSYMAKNLVVATGGKSFPATGSTGDGYAFAEKMGHSIVKTRPALTALFCKNFSLLMLSGSSIKNAEIKIRNKKGKNTSFRGELLITHKGISGPLVLDASRYICENDELLINVTKFSNFEEIFYSVKKILSANSKKDISNVQFVSDISETIRLRLLLLSGIDPKQKCAALSDKRIAFLCRTAMNIPFKVSSKGDFNVAMATAGGVNRRELKSNTMESRIVNNLFFAGEVIDIDGDTGGYNIQAAFSTAVSVADEINKKN